MNDVSIHIAKAWTAIDRLWILWNSNLSHKIKRDLYQVVTASVLLYGCTTWRLTKRMKQKPDKNATRCFEQIPEAKLHKTIDCTVTYLPSHQPKDEQDMLSTAGEMMTKSKARLFFCISHIMKQNKQKNPYVLLCNLIFYKLSHSLIKISLWNKLIQISLEFLLRI